MDPKACLMPNLYDLLGVRPDDDAENIKQAFRKAAKASHPDHHGGDAEAAARFRHVSEAYEVLRDAGQRAAYDRRLEFERRPLLHKVKQSMSDMKRHVVHDVIAGVLLAAVLVLGYELFAHISQTPSHGAADVTAAKSAQAVASAANDHNRADLTSGQAVSNPEQTISVARRDGESDLPAGADASRVTEGEPPLRHDVPSLDAPSSTAEERNIVPAADDRRDGKTPELEPTGANAGGMKPPETRTSARTPAASRPRFEQAALENRNTPAPDSTPSRIFGAGF
jgi:curved DNA-binding protein CbpA